MSSPLVRNLLFLVEYLLSGSFVENRALKNRYQDKKCFILGTGASLNDTDFSGLADEYVFGCNLLFKHKDFSLLNVNFYSVIMHYFGFVYNDREIIYDGINNSPLHSDAIVFLRGMNRPFIEGKREITNHKKVFVRAGTRRGVTPDGSINLAGGVDYMSGVIFFQIAAALYMGFKEIYLLGCGYTTEPRQIFHFYDEPPYFTDANYPWETPNFPLDIPSIERRNMAEQFAEARGLRIHSALQGFGYETFRMVDDVAECSQDYYRMRELAAKLGSQIFNIVPPDFESPAFDTRTLSEALT